MTGEKYKIKIRTGIDFSNPSLVRISADDDFIKSYDYVIGAFGVNSNIKNIIDYGYKPPKTIKFLQFEVSLPEEFIKETYRNRVQMFPIYKKGIKHLVLTPKHNFITVTVFGKNRELTDVKSIIAEDNHISHYLPEQYLNILCSCTPELPVGLSKLPYNKRFLIVGDACVSRYLKNGIDSAYQTAYLAAKTIIKHDVRLKSFKKHYYKQCRKLFVFDNFCGKIIYLMDHLLYSNSLYTEALMMVLKKEQISKKEYELSDIFWDIFTGDKQYKKILKNALHPLLILRIIKEFIFLFLKYLFKGKSVLHLTIKKLYRLLNGSTVVIIGGGPAGAASAIKLAKLAKEKELKLRIVLFEGKDFQRHHNQCVGILSPPITTILEKELDIVLPGKMIKSEVPGYELNTEKEQIFLTNYRKIESKTFSVRRSEFDNYLLNKAKENGVEIINSRVTNLEFYHDRYHNEVRIFSESNFITADVIICAFGLDEELLERLHVATKGRFKKPKKIMRTFITRFDYPIELLNDLYDRRIFAFLLSSVKNAEFGAVTIKDDHIVVNIAGEKITSVSLREFISLKKVKDLLPEKIYGRINYFSGKFPTSPAVHPFGDRYVTVG